MSSSVPEPSFGPAGFVAPSEADILAGVTADINAALGGGVNPGLSTPQGQIATTETAIIGDKNAEFIWFVNNVDPAFNSGRMQDAIARIYFLARNPALPTIVQCTCSGLTGATIPLGALAKDAAGNVYFCQQQGVIPSAGIVTLQFANQATGPIPCPAGTLNQIYQQVTGWDSITNAADGVLGNVAESPRAFEDRRAASTAANSLGSIPSVLGAVLSVAGVLDAFVYDNSTGSPLTYGGVTIAAHSLYVCAAGGVPDDVAFAIWTKKAPGCGYTGNTTVTIQDPSPAYLPPPPSYQVSYEIPATIDFSVVVTLTNGPSVPADALIQIQNAIVAAFSGADGGTRARIGATVYASRFYAPVALLGAWAQQIIAIQVGANLDTATYAHTAVFRGSITSNVLAAASVTGTIAVGNLIADTTGQLAGSSYIIAQLTGPTGGAGTYTVTSQPNLGSASFTGVIASHVLTASSVTGVIVPGMLLVGTSVASTTFILAQLTGTAGGAGTYSVTSAQADVGSESMTAFDEMTTFPLGNDITININQVPAISAPDISLVLV